MNTVYSLTGPKNDFQAATVAPVGLLVMPSFECAACKCYGGHPSVWYASLQATTAEARALCEKGLPETVAGPAEFAAIRDEVSQAFRTDVPLWPGYIIGARPISVKSRGAISEFTTKQLKQGIDVIQATFSYVLSARAIGILKGLGIAPPTGTVTFKSGDGYVADYTVLELQPQAVWTEPERANYGVTVCDVCGACFKKVLGGTFRMKQFRGDVFRKGNVLVRGAEHNTVYVNQPVFERLSNENLTGLGFWKAGEWV